MMKNFPKRNFFSTQIHGLFPAFYSPPDGPFPNQKVSFSSFLRRDECYHPLLKTFSLSQMRDLLDARRRAFLFQNRRVFFAFFSFPESFSSFRGTHASFPPFFLAGVEHFLLSQSEHSLARPGLTVSWPDLQRLFFGKRPPIDELEPPLLPRD